MKRLASGLACVAVFVLAGALATAQAPTPEETQEANLKAYVNLMRQDLKKQKVSILTELMVLQNFAASCGSSRFTTNTTNPSPNWRMRGSPSSPCTLITSRR